MTDDVVYDTSVLIGAERSDRAVAARHQRLLARDAMALVPAPVLAQAWRGGPQPLLSRLLTGCQVVGMDEDLARQAGRACAAAGTSDVVDATVVVLALRRRVGILSGDPDDIERLVAALGGGVPVEQV